MIERGRDYCSEALAGAGIKSDGAQQAQITKAQHPAKPWNDAAFTAAQLQCMEFPPISWIISNIVPAEGVTLLCSKPKFGKSWLAYDLCIACTTDRFTLGTIKPAQGDVLYLALEDSKRRLQRRMTKLLPSFDARWSERLTLTTEWRRLHEGGLDDIREWYAETARKGGKPILAVIDVLAKVRKPVGNRQLYEADYAALGDLHKLAHELGLAIVVVHHTRKMAADDLMETVSGSYGVSGAVDTILVMATKASGSVLDVRGRDVESAELAIAFNKRTCRWQVLGNAAEVHVSEQRAKIIGALKEAGGPMKVVELAEAVGMKRNPMEVLLGRMTKEGEIQRLGKGLYAHRDYVSLPDNDPVRNGSRGNPPESVTSVHATTWPKGCKPKGQCSPNPKSKRENTGVCPSVASVHDNADTGGSIPTTQTDQTDRHIGVQAAVLKPEMETDNLSANLSDPPDRPNLSDLSDGDRSAANAATFRSAPPKGVPAADLWEDLGIPDYLDRSRARLGQGASDGPASGALARTGLVGGGE